MQMAWHKWYLFWLGVPISLNSKEAGRYGRKSIEQEAYKFDLWSLFCHILALRSWTGYLIVLELISLSVKNYVGVLLVFVSLNSQGWCYDNMSIYYHLCHLLQFLWFTRYDVGDFKNISPTRPEASQGQRLWQIILYSPQDLAQSL